MGDWGSSGLPRFYCRVLIHFARIKAESRPLGHAPVANSCNRGTDAETVLFPSEGKHKLMRRGRGNWA